MVSYFGGCERQNVHRQIQRASNTRDQGRFTCSRWAVQQVAPSVWNAALRVPLLLLQEASAVFEDVVHADVAQDHRLRGANWPVGHKLPVRIVLIVHAAS